MNILFHNPHFASQGISSLVVYLRKRVRREFRKLLCRLDSKGFRTEVLILLYPWATKSNPNSSLLFDEWGFLASIAVALVALIDTLAVMPGNRVNRNLADTLSIKVAGVAGIEVRRVRRLYVNEQW